VGRGVVAAGALGLHAEEGGGDDGGLGGHGDVVLRGDAEAGRAAGGGRALEAQEFGDHQVERLMVDERFVDPPAEGAGIVEGRVEDVRVLGEDVLPVAHAVVGGARIGEQAVDGLGALVRGNVRGERGDLVGGGRHADGVERHTAQEGEVVGQRREARRERAVFRPGGAFLDPLFDERDVGGGEAMALRRHHLVGVVGTDTREEGTPGGVARDDGRAVALPALERAGEGVEVQAALGLAALVAFEAAGLEDRLDLGVELDAALLHGLHLALVGDDLLGEEMVDGIVRGEARSQRGHGSLRRAREPLLRGFTTFLPILALAGAGGGAGGGVDLGEAFFLLRGVGVPAGVVIGRGLARRRKQLPIRATGEGDRGDGLAEFGAAAGSLVVDHVADDGLEDDAMLAALGLEFGPGVTIARRREAEVSAEVEVVVLRLDRLVVGAGRREGRLDDELAVDEEGGGAAAAEEEAVFAGGEFHDAEGAEEVGVAAFGAHAGVDVFLRHAGEAEGGGDVAVGDGEGLVRPDVGGRVPVLAEFDAYLAVGHGGPVDLRRRPGDFRDLGGLRAAGAVVAGIRARADLGDLGHHDRGQGGGEASGDLGGGHERAVKADLIDRAAEAAVREAAL